MTADEVSLPYQPISPGSLLYRFVNGDNVFHNSRFKIVNRMVKGSCIVKAAVGENYLEIDVDIESSAIANVVLHLALGYVTVVMIDMRFVVEAQEEEELPERLIGAVRIAQMELSSATFLETPVAAPKAAVAGKGTAKVNDGRD
ncbi:protein ENHANCED DISEASE RESISTANCE 2-like [Asparagus officinalis]|uniref:protein ENHANCED DISEASE RESISTANCE 2-like n=1 Tax=Asparagus officinalis TaxID=4686 RepID=UPI00098E251E|nr:protein ENHANCED DISEASE RESISTANCE 2-like [Asparagus officinalis]